MGLLSRYTYYAQSIVTLLTRFERPGQIVGIFLGRPGALPAEVRLRREGWRFRVREAMDVWVIKETCLDQDYMVDAPLEPDWRVVDIGAGLGDFSVFAARQCPDGVVHAYEPLASSFDLLTHNLALNEITNVRTFREATGAAGRVGIAGDAQGPAVSTRFAAGHGEAAAPSVDLAQILDRLPGGRCDFLKIDCEGCEYELLLGSRPETLARVQRISAETHDGVDGHTPAELAQFLAQNGFQVKRRPNPVHDHLGFLYVERVQKEEWDADLHDLHES
jgi:FkbM family methyltransferase